MLISIIIPTYNSAKTLAACLESILSQQCGDFEVLLVDGLSTDQTIAIAESYKDKRIKIVSEKDKGIYDAMNKGIDKAAGDWLLFLGSDDELFDSEVLKNACDSITKIDADLIYGDVLIKGDSAWAKEGDIYDGLFTIEKLVKKNICHQSIFYRRVIFQETGKFNILYTICADWDMNHRFFARGKTAYIPYTISRFYAGGESTRKNNDLFTERDCVMNIKEYYGISFLNKFFHIYKEVFYNIANKALMTKNFRKSIYYFGLALFHADNKYAIAKAYITSLSAIFKKAG